MLSQSNSNKKGYWIEKLKEILKEENIEEEEEEENSQNNSSSNDNIQNQISQDGTQDRLSNQAHSQKDVSFLENDNGQGKKKEQNKIMYEKVAEAFYKEQSFIVNDEGKDLREQMLILELERQESFIESENEFDEKYKNETNKPHLDIVEMNEFDRIRLYQDHTILQKIYKKIWHIKTLINWVALQIINHPLFETISLGVIIFNSILLSLDDPTTTSDNNAELDQALLIIYTVEMGLKIIALGFIFNKGAYLRDTWNIIDIVIIITGFLPQNEINLSALRSLRVLRPLKSITKIKALKQLIQALLSAIPLLKDSIIILSFFFIIFGIAGLQLFTGQLKSRCIDPYFGVYDGGDGDNVIVCSTDTDCIDASTNYDYNLVCAKTMISPYFDTIQFDTFGWSVLNVYVIVSLEGWTKIMNLMQSGFSYFSIFYFFIVIYIGAFFLMNLTMAIIGVKYTEAISHQQQKEEKKSSQEQGFNIKDMIDWGIYKSNKVYYKELEEEKKKQHSLFGFSETFGYLADKFKTLLQKQFSSGKIGQDNTKKNDNQEVQNFEQAKDLKIKNNQVIHHSQELNLIRTSPQVSPDGAQNMFSKFELIQKQDPADQENKQQNQAPRIPIENIDSYQIQPIPQTKQKTLFLQGGLQRNLKNKKTKLLSKKLSRLDSFVISGRTHQLVPSAPIQDTNHQRLQKLGSNSPTQIKKVTSSSQNNEDAENQPLSQINEAENQYKNLFENGGLISPKILQEQLEQIGNKSEKQGMLSSSRRQSLNQKNGIKRKKSQSLSTQKNFKQIIEGDRKINLAPIKQQNFKKKSHDKQQTTLVNDNENMLASKKLTQNMLQSNRFSLLGDINIQRDSIISKNNDSLLKVDSQGNLEYNKQIKRRSIRSKQLPNIVLDTFNSGSKRNSNSNLYDSLNLEQFNHDEFLQEIELKEKIHKYNKKYKENEPTEEPNTDALIENNYSSTLMSLNQLKSKKLLSNDNQINSENYQVSPLKIQNDKTHKQVDGSTRNQSRNQDRSEQRVRGDKSQESISNSIQSRRKNQSNSQGSQSESNQKSKTKTMSALDQLSEESDISMNSPYHNNEVSNIKSNSLIQNHGFTRDEMRKPKNTLIFNDEEFLKLFGKDDNKNRETKKNYDQTNKKMSTKLKTQILNNEPEFKRQESGKIDRKYYVNVDEKLDMKKEEMKLLLNSKILKARVLQEEANEYTEDVQPLKKLAQQERRKAEQNKKIKSLRFVIKYSSKKVISKKKQQHKKDEKKQVPYRKSNRIDLLNKQKLFAVLDNQIIDDAFSKNKSINQDKPFNNFDNKSYHSQKNQTNQEEKIRAANNASSHNIDFRSNQQDVLDGSVNQFNTVEKNQENNAADDSQQNNQMAKGDLSDRKIDLNAEMSVDNTLNRLKTKKSLIDEIKKQGSIDSLSKKHQYSSTKPIKLNISQDKGGKKKKVENEIKWESWDYKNVLDRIFLDIEEENQKQKQKDKKSNEQSEGAQTVDLSKSIFSNSTYRRKDSKFSQGSESMVSKSSFIESGGSMSNMTNSIPDAEYTETKTSKKQGEEKSEQVAMEEFEKEPIEYDYVTTRKKEIQNLEKKGSNLIRVDWSADAVIPQTIALKEQKQFNLIISNLNHNKYETEQNEGGIIGIIQAFRRRVRNFVLSPFFENSIMICVIINTIILSLDGIVTDTSGLNTISQFNIAFTIIFAVDMVLKIIGMGITEYVSDKMNIFDSIIVCLSIFELLFITETGSGSSFSAFRAIRILRVFRVLRVTRLVRSLQFMKLMITAIGSSLSQFIYILLLLFLFMFIYTLLGMSLFGGSFYMDSKPTRMSFDSFLSSAFAILQLITIENWNNLLQICIRSSVNNYLSVLFLISWMFIGNYIFMNLVLAIIMDSFDSAEVQAERREIENRFEVMEDLDFNYSSVATTIMAQTSNFGSSNYSNSIMNKLNSGSFSTSQKKLQNDSHSQSQSLHSQTLKTSQNELDEEEQEEVQKQNVQKMEFVYFAEVKCQLSLYIFSQKNRFRKVCYRLYKHPYFEQVVLVAIALSSFKLTIDTYVHDQTSDIYNVGLVIDKIFTSFFALESLIKIISLGFIFDENSYLRDSWSQLDFFTVICSIIDVSVTSIDLSAIKILRLLRTLRPLRLLNHNKSMKLIVTALMESVGGISNMIMVVILIWLMFAILALNLMKGKMNYCNFPDGVSLSTYAYNQDACQQIPGAFWDRYDINCDNIGSSMLFLFILSSFEGWPDYVWSFIDGNDSGPTKNNSAYFAFFFAVFIFVGGFFSINLFSAIMSFNFDIAQKKAKNKYLSDEQSEWIELQRMIAKSTPDFNSLKKPQNKIRFFLWQFVRSSYVEIFIIFCILCNIVTMAMAYDTSPASYDAVLNNLNIFFTSVFVAEAIIKIIAFGPRGYFFNGWNQFDFFVVCASIVDIVTTYMGKSFTSFLRAGPQIARVLRVLRVSRLLKLIKSFQNLQKLIQTTIFALPHLLNATSIFLLFYFIFAILGCYLFSSVNSGKIINQYNNFKDFHSAFIILFRCSTGEDWMTVMFDLVRGTNHYAIAYFVIFIIIQTYMMMNLFVLIIINQFEENYIDPDNPLQNFTESEANFKDLWGQMTEKEMGIKIHERFLTEFYFQLQEPLGYDYNKKKKDFIENLKLHNPDINDEQIKIKCEKFKIKQRQEADKRIMQMNIFCDYEGYIFYNELFFYFFKFSLIDEINDFPQPKNQKELEKQIKAIQIIRKEENITFKKINHIKKRQSQLIKQKINKKRKEGVNPMVRRLFVGMCFQSWLQYSRGTQKKIQDLNFNHDDISSQSETDSDAENNQDDLDFLKNEDDEKDVLQFRQDNKKKKIISREHTIFNRRPGQNEKNPNNLYEKDRYVYLPNTDIYKDEYLIDDENYYTQQVFQVDPSQKKFQFSTQDKIPSDKKIQKELLKSPTNQSIDTPIHFQHNDHLNNNQQKLSKFNKKLNSSIDEIQDIQESKEINPIKLKVPSINVLPLSKVFQDEEQEQKQNEIQTLNTLTHLANSGQNFLEKEDNKTTVLNTQQVEVKSKKSDDSK